MLDAPTVISFATGVGVGSVLTAVVQHVLDRNAKRADALHDSKRHAFDELLVIYAELGKGWSDEKAKQLALCQARIRLVASNEVVESVSDWFKSPAGSAEREQTHEGLLNAMRRDLGVRG